MLAAKAALVVRVDALGEESNTDLGIEFKAKLELRLREMESGFVSTVSPPSSPSLVTQPDGMTE